MTNPGTAGTTLPSRLALAKGPALITLVILLVRLGLELAKAPAWLASRDAGGAGAVIGISWLPIVFGPWFAIRIGRALPTMKARLKRLATTLIVYGYLVRVPVVILTFVAAKAGWDTHFTKTPPDVKDPTMLVKILMTFVAQFGFWIVWTLVSGFVCGLIALAIAKPSAPAPAASPAR